MMEFSKLDSKLVVLWGMHPYPPQTVSTHRMEVDLRHGYIVWAVELRVSEAGRQTKPPPPQIQDVLDRYAGFFGDIPPGRPPDRGFEHTIEMKPGVQAVITTPYRHPKAYKDEIE